MPVWMDILFVQDISRSISNNIVSSINVQPLSFKYLHCNIFLVINQVELVRDTSLWRHGYIRMVVAVVTGPKGHGFDFVCVSL